MHSYTFSKKLAHLPVESKHLGNKIIKIYTLKNNIILKGSSTIHKFSFCTMLQGGYLFDMYIFYIVRSMLVLV